MRAAQDDHRTYCRVDLHARTIILCTLDSNRKTLLHKDIPANPKAFLDAIAPLRDVPNPSRTRWGPRRMGSRASRSPFAQPVDSRVVQIVSTRFPRPFRPPSLPKAGRVG